MMRKSSGLITISYTLIVVLLITTFALLWLINSIENDAMLINKAGIIRGSIQRLAKLESSQIIDNQLYFVIDELIWDFYSRNLHLKGRDDHFISSINRINDHWESMKIHINDNRINPSHETRDKLFDVSEDIWEETNNAVLSVQTASETKVGYFRFLIPVLVFNIILVTIIISFMKNYVRDELEHMSSHDTLTGIYNRSFFNGYMDKAIERFRRYNEPLSLILIDIDHFKHVNDNYGHQVGDEVLRELSSLISSIIRKSDVFARIGGEEFALICSKTTIEDTCILAEKLRKETEKHPFKHVEHLTISLGVSKFSTKDNPDSFFKRADIALYNAKNNGRNRVESYNGSI